MIRSQLVIGARKGSYIKWKGLDGEIKTAVPQTGVWFTDLINMWTYQRDSFDELLRSTEVRDNFYLRLVDSNLYES